MRPDCEAAEGARYACYASVRTFPGGSSNAVSLVRRDKQQLGIVHRMRSRPGARGFSQSIGRIPTHT